MKRVTKQLSALLVAFFLLPHAVFASTLISVDAGSDDSLVTGAKYPTVCFTVAHTMVVDSISVGIYRTDASWILDKLFNNDTNTVVWDFGANDVQYVGSTYNGVSTTTTSFTLTPDEYCVSAGSNNGSEHFVGDNNDAGFYSQAYGPTLAQVVANNAGSAVGYFGSVNYALCNASENPCPIQGVLTNTETRIISRIVPVDNSVTASSTVQFQYSYYFNSTTHAGLLDDACIELTNASTNQQVESVCDPITASGVSTFSDFAYLTEKQFYTWRPYLTSSTTSQGRVYGVVGYFATVQRPVTQSIIPPSATSTDQLQGWFSAVQNTILGVPPWSYWVQMRSIMNDSADLLTATSSVPAFSFVIGATSTPIHFTVVVFDKTAMNTFIPESAWATGKSVIGFAMWVLFALMIYHEVHRRFSKPHS